VSKKVQQQDVRHSRGPVPAKSKRTPTGQPDRPVFELNAAGIDIGAREIYVAVPADRDEQPVRKCETFTGDLHQMAEWLVRCGITTVAMKSTGV
jgi:transposase